MDRVTHRDLDDAGQTDHAQIDRRLPTEGEKDVLADLIAGGLPVEVTGARDDLEAALANLLTALAALGLITDSTTAS